MDNADVQEMLGIAILAKESGFPRIQADPADIIEVFEQRNELLEALELLLNRVQLDADAKNWFAKEQNFAMDVIDRAKG